MSKTKLSVILDFTAEAICFEKRSGFIWTAKILSQKCVIIYLTWVIGSDNNSDDKELSQYLVYNKTTDTQVLVDHYKRTSKAL